QGPGHSHWSYEDVEHWGVVYPDCARTSQSPINIDVTKTIFSPHLRPIQLSGYSLPANQKLKLSNNGHTVVLELPETLAITGGYAQQYRAVQLHLHWGRRGSQGKGPSQGEWYQPAGTGQSLSPHCTCHCCGVSVLQVGPRENPYYQEIFEHLNEIGAEGEEVMVSGFNIAGLLPANLKFYFHYNGSLTTPPCYQTVKWTVFNQTVLISREQMSTLAMSLRNEDSEPLQNNYRPVQGLNGRRVLASFQTTLSLEKPIPPGDVLAVLFGVLFAITALAFLLYIYKHRSQNARLDSPTKSKVIYTAASTENT
ncbi:Carbonic anhydrase 9, partial [Calypte anna]